MNHRRTSHTEPEDVNPSPDPIAVKPKEAARLLSISERTLASLDRSGSIKAIRVGRAVLYAVEELKRWAAENTGKSV